MRNVVVICLDTVRKDFFDDNSPRIKSASDLDVAECRSASAWSVPSHASLLTGELPHQHKIDTFQRSFNHLAFDNTFLQDLSEHELLGVSANVFAGPSYDFDQYFDEFRHMSSPSQRYLNGIDPSDYVSGGDISDMDLIRFISDSLNSEHPIPSLLNGLVGGISKASRHLPVPDIFDDGARPIVNMAANLVEESEEPYFLFTNFMDAHLPLSPHRHLHQNGVPRSWSTHQFDPWSYTNNREEYEEYWNYREELYKSSIQYLDRQITKLIDIINDISENPTTFVITADHGENIGLPCENGLVNHTSSLSEGLLHVPMSFVGNDGIIPSPEGRIVSHLDFPDIIRALAKEGSFEWKAIPRAEVMGRGPSPEPPSRKKYWNRTIRAAYNNDRKYVWDSLDNKEVYEVFSDTPNYQSLIDEQFHLPRNINSSWDCDIHTARQEALKNQQSVSVSQSTEDRLNDLGYL